MNKEHNKIETIVVAPDVCCLINSPELVILFFNNVKNAFERGKNVVFDMTNTTTLDETFVALLMGHIKDRNITKGLICRVEPPLNEECAKKLKQFGVFKKVADENLILNDDQNYQKVTNVIVANNVAKEIVNISSYILYGEIKRIKSLYAVLIELMANTNNHAGKMSGKTFQWWLCYFYCAERKVIKFIFFDFGVGIFESIPVKQYQRQNPFFHRSNPLYMLSREYNLAHFKRQQEILKIYTALVAGEIKSSTGLESRGKGIPLVCGLAMSDHFENFISISNDAYIDIKENLVSPMDQKFSGTLFCFELKESQSDE